MNKLNTLLLSILLIMTASVACAVEKAPDAKTGSFQKVLVYQDKPSANKYVPSGFMPDGKCVAVNDVWQKDCQEGRSCIKAEFNRDCATSHMIWAGVYWLNPANNWGDLPGGLDLTGASKLTFWARGEKGGEVLVFKAGGVGIGQQYPDSDAVASEPITLTTTWTEYSIDLTGKNLSRIAGGFAWIGSAKDNPQNITFYLDNIYYN